MKPGEASLCSQNSLNLWKFFCFCSLQSTKAWKAYTNNYNYVKKIKIEDTQKYIFLWNFTSVDIFEWT